MSATDWADRMYGMLEPYTYADAQNDHSLQEFLKAIGEMYEEIIDLAYDTPAGDDGWTLLTDITRVPSKAIDWLSQFVGVTPVAGLTDQQKLDRIIAREGFKRGTPEGMRAAAAIFLTGTQSVVLYERDTSPYHLTVQTYKSETAPGDLPATNLLPNGGFETNALGWAALNEVTLTRDTAKAKYGVASGRIDVTGSSNPYAFSVFWGLAGDTAGRTFTHSLWVCGEGSMIGKTWQIGVQETGGAGVTNQTVVVFTVQAGWQRVSATRTIAGNDRTAVSGYIQATGPAMPPIGSKCWWDGVQFEENAVATPYIETDGAAASRGMGQGPVGAALRSQKPAGIVMVYNIIPGQTYQQLKAGHPLYSQVKSFYTNYDKVRSDTP